MDQRIALTVRYYYHCAETLDLAEKAGFRYISMGFGEECADLFGRSDWEMRIMELEKEIKRHHLVCVNTHLPTYFLPLSGEIKDKTIDLAQFRCLKATNMLGADVTAYHGRTHMTDGADLEKSFEETKQELEVLVPEAEKQGVLIGVENLPLFSTIASYIFPCFTPEHIRLIDYFNSKNICAVWDTGHANLMDYNQPDEIRKLGSRIKATHIHDNDKWNDQHLPPFMGNIDWTGILEAFKDIGYGGYLTLESQYYQNPMSEEYVKYLYRSIAKLDEMFQEI